MKVSKYDHEMSQSHTADQPMAPRGGDKDYKLPNDTMKTIEVKQPALSSPAR